MLTKSEAPPAAIEPVEKLIEQKDIHLDPECRELLKDWPTLKSSYAQDQLVHLCLCVSFCVTVTGSEG